MDPFTDKYHVFMISAGRTGSTFMGELLQNMIENTCSVHEPDSIDFRKPGDIPGKIRLFGLNQMIFGKLTGSSGIRNICNNYLSGKLSQEEVMTAIRKHREKYYNTISESLIIESNYAWFGLTPVIYELFKHLHIVIVVRNPQTWIQSNMNWERMYGKKDWISSFVKGRFTPHVLNDEENMVNWSKFDTFQKLCWAWNAIYSILYRHTQGRSTWVKYEDLFESPERSVNFSQLLEAISRFNDHSFHYNFDENLLNKRLNISKKSHFEPYESWSAGNKKFFNATCGDLMDKLGY